ncbi:hypothetical protein BT96DRAFT_987543 [Gymnopus androsaceus JB14]|uniref:Uncharacterized protein n=1 Tax=Gymnopus androsaceus JB14 TaxID=1447944 RepID=A0A6A4I798_9AGAR|nr:hypothetical protein BT96DRAFT_987543 [Gymnopus androsaceus JB14]
MATPNSFHGHNPNRLHPVYQPNHNGSDAYHTPISVPFNSAPTPRQSGNTSLSDHPGIQMGSGPGCAPYLQNQNFMGNSSFQIRDPITPSPLHVPTVTAPLPAFPVPPPPVPTPHNPRPLPMSPSAPLHAPTHSERLCLHALMASLRPTTVLAPPPPEPSPLMFASNYSCSSHPMSLTSFVPSPAPYIHLPYGSNMYPYIPQLHDQQDPQVPSRPQSVVVPGNIRIQHPQPYQPYATAHLVTIGEDAVIVGLYGQCALSVPPAVCPQTAPVPGPHAAHTMQQGVTQQFAAHPPGVAQYPPTLMSCVSVGSSSAE